MTLATDTVAALPEYVRVADEGLGGPLATWLAGLCDQVQPTVDMLADDDLVNPATCPPALLPYAGALGGIDLEGVPSADVRPFLAQATAKLRGSEAAIRQRVGLTLTGSRTITIETCFGGDPLAMRITTYDAETPNPAATEAAIRLEAPAWLVVTVQVAEGIDYTELTSRYATYDLLTATGYTYEQLMGLI